MKEHITAFFMTALKVSGALLPGLLLLLAIGGLARYAETLDPSAYFKPAAKSAPPTRFRSL